MDKEQATEILKFISKTNKLNIKSEVFDEAEKHDFKLETDAIDTILNELDKYQEEHEILLEKIKNKNAYLEHITAIASDYDRYYDRETKSGNIEWLADLVDETVGLLVDALQDKKFDLY